MKRDRKTFCEKIAGTIVGVMLLGVAWGQMGNEIIAVSPNSTAAGTNGVSVTFTLDADEPPPPPAGIPPDSVTLGSLTGTSVSHSSQYGVTALFAIPADEIPGPKTDSFHR